MLMPLADKHPLFKHKDDGAWTWPMVDRFMAEHADHTDWALLLDRICVLDADDEQAFTAIESIEDLDAREAVMRCPMQHTSKGRHYLFLRPSWADAEGYWDGARQSPMGLNVDFKSRCSTGTRGVLVIAPSKGKTWAAGRAPWDEGVYLQPLPRALAGLVARPRSRLSESRQTPVDKTGVASSTASRVTSKRRVLDTVDGIDNNATQLIIKHPINTLQSAMGGSHLERVLSLLSKSRWDDRTTWRDIAIALQNECGDTDEAFELWDRFSRMSVKYDRAEALKLWSTVVRADYEGPKITIRTLQMWAEQDDPYGYSALCVSLLPPNVRDYVKQGDRGLALIAHQAASDIMKRTADNVLYRFDRHKQLWIKCHDKADLWDAACVAIQEQLVRLEHVLRIKRGTGGEQDAAKLDEELRAVRTAKDKVDQCVGIRHVVDLLVPMLLEEGFERRLDSVPHLLGVKNGVVDLRTGELRARTPEDMVHTVCPVDYNPNADDSLIRETVLAAMADDQEMAEFVQRLLGYGITGEVSEEVFVVFTGSGRNSKGVLTQLISAVLGNFYREMNPGIIVDRRVSNIDAERGKLLGARLAVFNELQPGEKLRTNEVQLLSGGDGIAARPLYRSPLTIEPRHMCLLCTNHMPELTQVIPAIAERLICVHFPVTFTDLQPDEQPSLLRRQADRTLKTRLHANLAGVLNWLVRGAVMWYGDKANGRGLRAVAPAKVKEFSRQYLEEQDLLAAFIREQCEVADTYNVSSTLLLDRYCDWLSVQKKNVHVDSKSFVEAMRLKGFEKKRGVLSTGENLQGFRGIRLREGVEGLRIKPPLAVTSSASEREFASKLEAATGLEFQTGVRPRWLLNRGTGQSLELDMYNHLHRIAVEYDGPHHYKYPNKYHTTLEEFQAQQERDLLKNRLCAAHGVCLYRVRAMGDIEREVCELLQRAPELRPKDCVSLSE